MRSTVTELAAQFVKPGLWCIDLGASRGEATQRLVDRYGAALHYSCVETSPPMVAALRERFAPLQPESGYGYTIEVEDMDLRKGFPTKHACLVLSVLCLCFVPIEHRQRVVRRAYKTLCDGGAMIVVDKILGSTSDLEEGFVSIYQRKKRESGYTSEEIDRKAMSLEGVLVPVTARWNEDMLRSAGFAQVDCFWRWANFAGWVAIKGQ
jgi:tRNA (cmo5U34)-methyltransferase